MIKANQAIRQRIKAEGVCHWQVADVYGIHENSFSRMLRKELPTGTKERVLTIIKELAQKDGESR